MRPRVKTHAKTRLPPGYVFTDRVWRLLRPLPHNRHRAALDYSHFTDCVAAMADQSGDYPTPVKRLCPIRDDVQQACFGVRLHNRSPSAAFRYASRARSAPAEAA